MTGAQRHTNQCQTAHPPAYDQWKLTVYYLGVPCQPLMKGLIVSDRLWSALSPVLKCKLTGKGKGSVKEWHAEEKKGTPPSGEITATPVRHVSSGAWWILGKEKKKRYEKKETEKRKPFLFPSCHLLHIPASQIIISRPYSVNVLLDGYCQRCASLL